MSRPQPDAPASPPPVQQAQPTPLRIPLTRPRWVWAFFAVNVAIWLLMTLAGGSENGEVLIRFGANVAPLIVEGEIWRLFTANFLHIGIVHLVFNSYALYVLGPEMEALFGSPRFVAIYLMSGLSGSIFSFGLHTDVALSAGASTSIFGLVGALLAFFVRNRRHFGDVGRRRVSHYLFVAVLNLYIGLSVRGIDNLGHIGGFAGGLTLGWLLCPFYTVEFDGLERHVVDLNSLRGEWLGLALFVALLIAGVIGGVVRHSAF